MIAPVVRRISRRVIYAVLSTPLRPGTLAVVRDAVRARPRWRACAGAAFYAGEALAARGGELVGRLKTGSEIHLLANDHMHRYIYFHGEFEEPTTRFLQSVVRPGWTFLDVGANAGYFTLLAFDLGGTQSSVHAFEPNPAMADLLERSARRRSSTIQVVRSACGEQPGTALLHLSTVATNSGLSSLRSDVLPPSATRLRVPVVTLDRYCAENRLRPDVVKIDVEGHEISVLRGAAALLEAAVARYVITELVPERVRPADLLGLMSHHGYTAFSLDELGRLVEFSPLDLQNVVFARQRE